MSIAKKNGSIVWMVLSCVLALSLIVVLVANQRSSNDGSYHVATVNGEGISKDELYNSMIKSVGTGELNALIGKKLIEQEMKKEKLSFTSKEVDQEINSVKKRIGTEEEFQTALTQSGMTEEYFREEMTMNVQLKKLLVDEIAVTDEEIATYYEENKEDLKAPEQVYLYQIVVKAKEEAQTIANDLKTGKDFATIAKEKSIDTSSKEAGGVVGSVIKGYIDKAVEKVAFSIEENVVSNPIEAEDGFYIIKVSKHTKEALPTLDEKKAEIKETLMNVKLQKQSETWLNDVQAKSSIVNTLATE